MSYRDSIRRHEGKRNKVYFDSLGIPTIGIGRNLQDVGLSDDEVDYLYRNDLERAEIAAASFVAFDKMNPVRQGVLIEMCFQMGRAGVWKFKKFLAAAERQDWDAAANEMLDSTWAKQTPARAKELSDIFRRGTLAVV